MTYKQQLLTSEWAAKRTEILERDNYSCLECSSTKYLQIHHDYYVNNRMAWEYPNDALRTLCRKCHTKFHKTHKLSLPQTDEFFSLYSKYLPSFYHLTGTQIKVILYLANRSTLNTNEVRIVSKDRHEMKDLFKVSKPVIDKAIKVLIEEKFLLGSKGLYKLNPLLFWKGDRRLRN